MVNISERAVPYFADLKKRAAREYAEGYLTREEFDKLCEYQDKIAKIIESSDKRHAERDRDEIEA